MRHNRKPYLFGIILLVSFTVLAVSGSFIRSARARGGAVKGEKRATGTADQSSANEPGKRHQDADAKRVPNKEEAERKGKLAPTPKLNADEDEDEADDADIPPFMRGKINEQEYLTARQEWVNSKFGMTPGLTYDPMIRVHAIEQMEGQRAALKAKASKLRNAPGAVVPQIASGVWTELGPRPAPNGQTSTVNQPVSGRTVAIAIHPTNPNIVYVGGAQAGVYRTLNGGQTWTPIFDGAQSLVIGALALAPSNPDILYVGTGEAGQCGSGCYAGIGVYRIDNASTTANLTGPINPLRNYNDNLSNPVSANIFTGRAISKILVNPTDPSIIFVATASGVIGNPNQAPGGGTIPPTGIRGIYRLANATGPAPGVTSTKLTVSATNCFDTPCTGNQSILDMVYDGLDPTGNTIALWLRPTTGTEGGVYRTTNALTTGTFTNTLSTVSTTVPRGEMASVTIAGVTTMYLADGEGTGAGGACTTTNCGKLRKSIDGGQTWSAQLAGANNFCGGQCFYDISIAIDPVNANIAYVGGAAGTSIMRRTTDGFATVVNTPSRQVGLHADNHVLAITPAPNNNIIYNGTDGGIWRTEDSATSWQSLNNSTYSATQFQSIAIHPTDRYMTLGGSQDNGSHMMKANNEPEKPINGFTRVDFGDGGYARIDQTATDTTNVVMYHTYFNQTGNQIGFARVSQTTCAAEGQWAFKGASTAAAAPNACGDASGANGMLLTDTVQFYAPLELGPPVIGSTGNTVYFGTDRLYRSINKGDTMVLSSQAPITAAQTLTTIAISPQDDNYRVVGLTDGHVWGTATGSTTLVDITPAGAPARLVGKLMFDPTNKDIVYASYGGQAITANQHIWKTTNFSAVSPTWTATANGIPDVPVNALAVDPASSNNVYAGTDIGVFVSTDGGATWNPYGTGLPAIAVFDMALQNANRFLRIATHGRGWWEISLVPAGGVTISGTVTVTGAADNSGVTVLLNEGQQSVVTGPAGTYSFPGLNPGGNYTVRPVLSGRTFTPSFATFNDIANTQTGVNFTGALSSSSTAAAGSVIISEFREQGPGGSTDEYVELYNNTNSNITVATNDGSAGWGLANPSIPLLITVIPDGTVIPARGHFLVVGTGYSLRAYAGGDLNVATDIPSNLGIGLFNTANTANFTTGNLIDSVGFTGDATLGEGTRLTSIGVTAVEHAFVRKFLNDTNNNAADFVLVSTSGATIGSTASALGAPNPADLASPLHDNASIASAVVDPAQSPGSSPNRDRCPTCTSTNAPLGTLTLRRRFTNNTAQTITRLRFHVMQLSTLNNTEGQSSPADLRQLTSASTTFATAPCVQGTMVEQPAVQVMGGGLNSTVTADLSGDFTDNCNDDGFAGLAVGEGVNLQFALGVQTAGNFQFLVYVEALPHGGGSFFVAGNTEVASPTAAPASISGSISAVDGSPLAGVSMNLGGALSAETITDSNGNYSFAKVETNGFYTVTPALANYTFSPANRSFSLVANKTDAVFTGSPNATASTNAIDTNEYFVRQQYLDFLSREPDQSGFDYWVGKLNRCNTDLNCRREARIDVSAAFFNSEEFQDTGSYVYRLYQGALGRQLTYAEFTADRSQVVGGANLNTSKTAFANAFVSRAEFAQTYQTSTTADSFVDALLQTTRAATGVDLASARATLISHYQTGSTMNESRALVVRDLAENSDLGTAVYNPSFVLMEYFGYLHRGAEPGGYGFWLNVLNQSDPQNYRGMVCSFITSTEYQHRFGNVVTRSNADCAP
jgi:hypothetical protein